MKHILARFRSFCVGSFPLVAFVLVVSNFFISFRLGQTRKPVYSYRTFVVTNYIHSVVTNFVVSSIPVESSSTTNSVSSLTPPPVYQKEYRYFLSSSRRMVYMDGSYFSEGDYCSRGLIVRIFPDIIYLHDGSTIENTYRHPTFEKSPLIPEFTNTYKRKDKLK